LAETIEEKRQRLLGLAREAVSKAYSTGEHSIAQASNAYGEIDKSRNLIHERVEEWYGIYFPELGSANQERFARFVVEAGANKKAAGQEQLRDIFGDGAEQVRQAIEKSIGSEPGAEEFKALRALASMELELGRVAQEIDAYMKENVPKLMPNVAFITDYRMAAELLSRAGSLAKLASMPAGTIQLLGAEKALFRHLRTGARPPKYGAIFKLKEVTSAERWNKGRVARLFAAKIGIAARADAISKRFIGKELRQELDRALARIGSKRQPQGLRSRRTQPMGGFRPQRGFDRQGQWKRGRRQVR
jgi:nucleolar protein 56